MLWNQNENEYTWRRERLIASISANVKLFEGLNLRLRGGTDRYSDKKENKEMFVKYADPADMTNLQGSYQKIDNHYEKNYGEALLMFNKTFAEDFDVTANLGTSAELISETGMTWKSQGLKYNGMFSTNNNKRDPKTASLDSGYNRGEYLGAVFASAQLAYKRYLYLDLTARNDWSSRLPADNRSFFYPSVGLGFVFTDAFKLPSWYNYGKVRASYAIVGNSTPSIYFTNNSFNYGSFDNSAITNWFDASVPPTNVIPEKNYGVELQLTGTPIETKDFSWESILNFSFTHNELISLVEGMDDRQIAAPWDAALFKAVPGYATPSVFIRKWMRDDQGNMLVDKNGNYMQESEYTYAGSAAPKFIGGFTNTFRYKNVSLSVHIDGSFGGKLLSFTNNYLKSTGSGIESLFGRDEEYGGLPYYIDANTNQKVLLDSHSATLPANAKDGLIYHDGIIAEGVKEDGSKNDIVVSAADYYNSRYNVTGSEDNLYDNTYIKLRELKLSYRVPEKIYSKLGLQNLNVSFVGSNLFFIYKSVPNINPESTLGTNSWYSYVEYTTYPAPRSFGFSINTSF